MKTIIALRGKANVGKSATIRILNEILVATGYQPLRTTFNQQGIDFITIFIKNNKKIGITSSGDTYDLVHHRLQELVDEDCEVCVCACRTYDRVPPGTNAAILEFVNYHHQFVSKTIDYSPITQQQTNNSDARTLTSIIDQLSAL